MTLSITSRLRKSEYSATFPYVREAHCTYVLNNYKTRIINYLETSHYDTFRHNIHFSKRNLG